MRYINPNIKYTIWNLLAFLCLCFTLNNIYIPKVAYVILAAMAIQHVAMNIDKKGPI